MTAGLLRRGLWRSRRDAGRATGHPGLPLSPAPDLGGKGQAGGPHLTVVVQLGQREVHALVLLLELIEARLPAAQLQLRAVQRRLQLLGVGAQLLVLPLQLVVQESDPAQWKATGNGAEERSKETGPEPRAAGCATSDKATASLVPGFFHM